MMRVFIRVKFLAWILALGKHVNFTSIIKIQLIHQRSKGDSERNLLNRLGMASMLVQILVFVFKSEGLSGPLRTGIVHYRP